MKKNYRRSAFWALATSLALGISPTIGFAQFNASGSTLSSSGTSSSGSGSSSLGSSLGGTSSTSSGSSSTGGRGNAGGNSGNSSTTSTPAIPTASNIIGATYGNPNSLGLASNYYPNSGSFGTPNTAAATFGKAIFTQTNTTASSASQAATTASGFSTVGQTRSPVYSTMLSKDVPMVEHSATDLQSKVRAALARSSYLKNKQNIQVAVENGVVVLQGQVLSEQEYRAAGALASTEPGVRSVLNQLQIVDRK